MIQIGFTPIGGSPCTLNIDDGGSGVTTIDGTVDAFTTEEDSNTDLFLPVRTTSGTIRFYNDGAWGTLADISDFHKKVELTGGGTWKGYINKGYIGSRPLFATNDDVCEICVQCPLSELDTIDYAPVKLVGSPFKSIATVINELLSNPFGDGVITPVTLPSSVSSLANMQVYVESFYVTDVDTDGTTTSRPKYTYKEALEEMMKLICCTARWTGTQVEISAPGEYADTEMLTINPADTESEETAVVPFKNVEVNAEADGGDSLSSVNFPTNVLRNWAQLNRGRAGDVQIPSGIFYRYAYCIFGSSNNHYPLGSWRNINDGTFTYNYGSTAYMLAFQEARDNDLTGFSLSPAAFINYPEDIANISNPTWSGGIRPTTFTLQSKANFFAQDCILVVQMRIKDFSNPSFKFVGPVKFRIGFAYTISGQEYYMYWNEKSNAWEDSRTYPSLDFFITAETENGELVRTSNLDYNFDTYSGYGIPVTSALSGKLKVEVKIEGHDSCVLALDSLEVKVVRHVADLHEKSTYVKNGTKGSGTDSVDLAYCSERRSENAINFLFDGNGKVITTVNIGSTAKRPEQWVADRRAAMSTDTVRKLLKVRQLGNIAVGKYSYDGKIYDTLAINHEWGDNITEATLIEIG